MRKNEMYRLLIVSFKFKNSLHRDERTAAPQHCSTASSSATPQATCNFASLTHSIDCASDIRVWRTGKRRIISERQIEKLRIQTVFGDKQCVGSNVTEAVALTNLNQYEAV